MWLRCVCGLSLRATMSSIICRRSGLTVLVSLMGSSFLSEVDDTSILRTGALHCYHYPLSSLPASRLLLPRSGLERSDFVLWHKTDLPMQSPLVRCWGNNGSRISVLRFVFPRRRRGRARGKLEQRCSRALASLLALLADQPPGEVVDACRRHVGQGA